MTHTVNDQQNKGEKWTKTYIQWATSRTQIINTGFITSHGHVKTRNMAQGLWGEKIRRLYAKTLIKKMIKNKRGDAKADVLLLLTVLPYCVPFLKKALVNIY